MKPIKYIMALAFILGTTAHAQVSEETLKSISTPDKVKTSIGTLKFFDGAPMPKTAQKAYDYLDTMRGVDAYLKGMPFASMRALVNGAHAIGAKEAHQVMILDKLLDSKSLFVTGNTITMYVVPDMDLKKDGPMVLEVPPGMLGAFNDAWFQYIEDIGPFGPDKGKGGKFLVLPPGYKGKVPAGYFVVRSKTNRTWAFMRASVAKGVDAAFKNVEDNFRIYPLSKQNNPPKLELIRASGESFNTISANTFKFYEELNEVIQSEPLDGLSPETRGLFASIGIEKGKPFSPDARMKKILTDAVAIGNGIARSIVWYPRTEGTMKGIEIYPGSNSAWLMAFLDKNVFFNGKDGQTINSDARVMFHYPYTAVTPAMAVSIPGKGSDYAIAYVDSRKLPFNGSKQYKLHIPANVPVNNFWAVTLYDSQTRSMLQTGQLYPTVSSTTDGFKQNADGSYYVYFGPEAPQGMEKNWLQTIPGKSWFVALRMYGPLKPWLNKTWRPSEIELVK